MGHDESLSHDSTPTTPKSQEQPVQNPRGVLLGATAVLMGFVLFQGPVLFEEWRGLQRDWEKTRLGQPLGFINISPDPSYAEPPVPWAQVSDEMVMLWAGWKPGVGHCWFRVGKDQLDVNQLNKPIGRDVVRSIDRPIAELAGGTIWSRMQPDTIVAGVRLADGSTAAYPWLLLQKVEAVNDLVRATPVLIVHTPFQPDEEAVDVFDPRVDGKRLTMGLSGHFLKPGQRPLLYDRETESLWVVRDHELVCLAGELSGRKLKRLQRPEPMVWDEWVSKNPGSRLIVGAFRDSPGTLNLQ